MNALEWPNCAKGTATVTADTLNVRADRSTESAILGKLARGTAVTVWAVATGVAGGDWYLIQTADGLTGWCSAVWLHASEALQA
jgi:N-acetylmuramoyl-L-alanine amidase